MTPKFRIYDKLQRRYCEEDAPLMLCIDGCIFDRANEDWYEVGERYVVEFELLWASSDGTFIYEGDVISGTNPNDGEVYISSFYINPVSGVRFSNHALSFELSLYEYSTPTNIKIVGTIHDEKYKGL